MTQDQYRKENPLDGPAKIFDAMANAILAGDSYESVLRQYGFIEAQPMREPLFWYRPRSDGMYEGPIHNAQIDCVRKESGAWRPLFTSSQSIRPKESCFKCKGLGYYDEGHENDDGTMSGGNYVQCDQCSKQEKRPEGLAEFIANLHRSRSKYPKNRRMFDALLGELDELRRAYVGDGDVRAEAFDVAVCAFRIAIEGDAGGNTALKPVANTGIDFRGLEHRIATVAAEDLIRSEGESTGAPDTFLIPQCQVDDHMRDCIAHLVWHGEAACYETEDGHIIVLLLDFTLGGGS